jgi:2-oxoglutarate dehydrogenase E1 component
MSNPTFATRWNADLIDERYAQWQEDPASLDAGWRAFFEGFELGTQGNGAHPAPAADPKAAHAGGARGLSHAPMPPAEYAVGIKQTNFTGTLYAYRSIGHTQADINPLFKEVPRNPRLTLERLGFDESDLDKVYWSGNYMKGIEMTLRELLEVMNETYCGKVGVEYIHIQDTAQRRWLQAKMEPVRNRPEIPRAKKRRIFDRIAKAEEFEHFLHRNFVGQKRFGLEGGETIIAALDALLEQGPALGVKEYVMGMAHRGRLNVLSSIFRKSYAYIFHEFSENYQPETKHGDGDVKYHLGFQAEVRNTRDEEVTLHLAANPSHLEAVDPVVQGRARARQRLLRDTEHRKQVVPVLIHGDAAFAGQGIVAEVLNFSQLPGYATGGTIHFIINNQIGFTTDPSEARSTPYCTDIAKMIEAPIFHVNGDDPEAMVWVTELALAYRQEFGRDVVIDMYCYRRHGHNESDEPAFTQPTLYKSIASHPSVVEIYSRRLIEAGEITEEEVTEIRELWRRDLRQFYDNVKEKESRGEVIIPPADGPVANYQPGYAFKDVATNITPEKLERIARSLLRLPPNFNINPKIKRQLETKLKLFEADEGIDWAFAEALAWGSLMMEGLHVRLSGQDCARGTFSQRHAIFYDAKTREKYIPLMEMEGREGLLCVHNSLLSEAAVLGFDYGYSLDFPEMLCMWEAQFGDFVNGAQVIIDQFISSSESKWRRVSGLVMLLPHGYEGQGPEHSSARLERFLQLCAEDNIQVANCTTPAQYFHILRRQMHRDFRKPLILMTPKSLLRHRECVSKIEEFTERVFQSILPDPEAPAQPSRIILCSGKVYYDLIAHRREHSITDAAIIRVEQFYPLNSDLLRATVGENSLPLVWCQEEPQNMGAWSFIAPRLEEALGRRPLYAGREAAASPAVGNLRTHQAEQAALVAAAFSLAF